MSGSWSDINYGYDQIGLNDPFDDEINIKHDNNTYKFSYEKNSERKRCDELLFDLQKSEEKIERLKKRNCLLNNKKKKIPKEKILKEKKNYKIKLFNEGTITLNIYILLFIVIFIMQLQIYENNKLINRAINSLSKKDT